MKVYLRIELDNIWKNPIRDILHLGTRSLYRFATVPARLVGGIRPPPLREVALTSTEYLANIPQPSRLKMVYQNVR